MIETEITFAGPIYYILIPVVTFPILQPDRTIIFRKLSLRANAISAVDVNTGNAAGLFSNGTLNTDEKSFCEYLSLEVGKIFQTTLYGVSVYKVSGVSYGDKRIFVIHGKGPEEHKGGFDEVIYQLGRSVKSSNPNIILMRDYSSNANVNNLQMSQLSWQYIEEARQGLRATGEGKLVTNLIRAFNNLYAKESGVDERQFISYDSSNKSAKIADLAIEDAYSLELKSASNREKEYALAIAIPDVTAVKLTRRLLMNIGNIGMRFLQKPICFHDDMKPRPAWIFNFALTIGEGENLGLTPKISLNLNSIQRSSIITHKNYTAGTCSARFDKSIPLKQVNDDTHLLNPTILQNCMLEVRNAVGKMILQLDQISVGINVAQKMQLDFDYLWELSRGENSCPVTAQILAKDKTSLRIKSDQFDPSIHSIQIKPFSAAGLATQLLLRKFFGYGKGRPQLVQLN